MLVHKDREIPIYTRKYREFLFEVVSLKFVNNILI